MLAIASPITQFFDLDGTCLDHGRVYFGPVGGNPETTPTAIYWDAAGTIPAAQPVITLNGFTVRNGKPAQLYVPGNYSIAVRNKRGALVVYAADSNDFSNTSQILTRLADSTDPANGAGMSGYDSGTVYIAGSVGYALNTLFDSLGSDFGASMLALIPAAMRADIIAGTSATDHLSAVQSAINALSGTTTRKVFFRAGKWNFSGPLRLYFDAIDNPGFNVERDGKFELIGEGRPQENYALTNSPHGTLFNFAHATADGLIVCPAALDTGPFLARDFVCRDIAFTGGTTGYLVRCNGVPQSKFFNCDFIQTNTAGNSLNISTAYFGELKGCRFRNTAGGAKTGRAITMSVSGAAAGAGLFKISDSDIQGHQTAFNFVSGSWTNMLFENTEFASDTGGHGIYIQSPIDQLNLVSCYFEGASVNWIADSAAGYIKSLKLDGCWGYGIAVTGAAAIDVTGPDAVTINGGTFQDLAKPFMRILGVPDIAASRGSYQVVGPSFKFYAAVAAPLTLFQGYIPTLLGAEISGGAAGIGNVKLFDANTKWPIDSKAYYGANSSMVSAGHVRQTHVGSIAPAINATVYTHASLEYAAIVMLATTAGTPILELKNGTTAKLGDMFTLDVINVGAGTVTVRREVGATTIVTVAANSKVRLFWSDLFNDWL